jgi:hypothetical protein
MSLPLRLRRLPLVVLQETNSSPDIALLRFFPGLCLGGKQDSLYPSYGRQPSGNFARGGGGNLT